MVYRTAVEERLATVIYDRWEALLEEVQDVGFLLDADECPEEALPFVAGLFSSDMYTELFGEDFERECLRTAEFINDNRGTEAAVDQHTANLGAMHETTFTREGNPQRIVEVDFAVTPSRYGIDTDEERAYYLRSYPRLLPLLLRDVTVTLEAPGSVLNLRAVAGTNNSLTLDWDDTPGANSYRVRRREAGTPPWVETDVTESGLVITGLSANQEYDIRVRASNALGNGPYTATLNATTAPLAPTNLRSTGQTSTMLTMAWNNRTGATGYDLRWRENGTQEWTGFASVSNNGHVVGMLAANTQYDFQVRATRGAEFASAWSGSVMAMTDSYPVPTAPQNLRTVSRSFTSIVIEWDASTGAESYSVRWKESSEPDSEYTSPLMVQGTEYTITPLDDGTEYSIQVRANGMGASSGYATHTEDTAPLTLRAPTNLRATSVITVPGLRTVTTFAWDAGADSYSNLYETYVVPGGFGPFTPPETGIAGNQITGTSQTIVIDFGEVRLWVRNLVAFDSEVNASPWVEADITIPA